MIQRELLMNSRNKILDELEAKMLKDRNPEDSLFFYHPNEDRIQRNARSLALVQNPFNIANFARGYD